MPLIAEAIIASFLSPDAYGQSEAAIAKRLEQIKRDVGISRPMLDEFPALGRLFLR